MARACSICSRVDRDVIDELLIEGLPMRRIAAQYKLAESSVRRHRAHHLSTLAVEAREGARADNLLARANHLTGHAHRIRLMAEGSGDLRTALASIRELTRLIELTARLAGELSEQPTVNIIVSQQWVEVRALVVDALAPFPQARLAVAEKLAALEAPR